MDLEKGIHTSPRQRVEIALDCGEEIVSFGSSNEGSLILILPNEIAGRDWKVKSLTGGVPVFSVDGTDYLPKETIFADSETVGWAIQKRDEKLEEEMI